MLQKRWLYNYSQIKDFICSSKSKENNIALVFHTISCSKGQSVAGSHVHCLPLHSVCNTNQCISLSENRVRFSTVKNQQQFTSTAMGNGKNRRSKHKTAVRRLIKRKCNDEEGRSREKRNEKSIGGVLWVKSVLFCSQPTDQHKMYVRCFQNYTSLYSLLSTISNDITLQYLAI